jgi:hypothetical protein
MALEDGFVANTLIGFTGANQAITVTQTGTLRAKLWGAATSGGSWRDARVSGGGGGYTYLEVPVTAGDQVIVQVGGRGEYHNQQRSAVGGWPDGGRGSYGDGIGAGGGGSSRLWLNGTLIGVAGGGGAGSGYDGNGGAGGGATGENSSTASGGSGGSQTAGGVDRSDTAQVAKQGKNILAVGMNGQTGGDGGTPLNASTGDDGGGGGGGYWGGGGGGGDSQAGGGGSGFIHSSAAGVTTAGVGAQPGNANDPDLPKDGRAVGLPSTQAYPTDTRSHGYVALAMPGAVTPTPSTPTGRRRMLVLPF